MKRLILLGVLLLGACAKKEDAPPPEPVAVAPPVEDSWPGKYEGDMIVTITGRPSAHKVWMIEAAADGCTGDLGVADNGLPARYVSDDALELTVTAKDAAACTVRIDRTGNSLTVHEDEGCGQYHGATCSFNGAAQRVK